MLTTWASETVQLKDGVDLPVKDLVLYLVDHGGNGTFRINQNEIVTATELNSWLAPLKDSIVGKITIVYDACHSGSFNNVLSGTAESKRIFISSASADESAYFVSKRLHIFFKLFLDPHF